MPEPFTSLDAPEVIERGLNCKRAGCPWGECEAIGAVIRQKPKAVRHKAEGPKRPKRKKPEMMATLNGVTMTVSDWAKQSGISYFALYGRLYRGYTLAEALAMGEGKNNHRRKGRKHDTE